MVNALRFVAFVVVLTASGCWSDKSEADLMIEACEDALKERLKSPSSYVRQKVTMIDRRPFTVEWWHSLRDRYAHLDLSDHRQRNLKDELVGIAERREHDGYVIAGAIIHYEADNSFGTAVRDQASCDVILDPEQAYIDGAFPEVLVNERTSFEWMLDNIRRP